MGTDLSAAGVVRRIYDHLAVDGWSCVRIANRVQLTLGMYPPSYRRDGRGVRGKRTQGNSGARAASATSFVNHRLQGHSSSTAAGPSKPNGREVISASVSLR